MNAIAARAIEAMDFLIDAVQQIPSERWDQPSNLDGWSIRDLVVHTTGSTAKLVALAGGQTSEATDDLRRPGLFGPAKPAPEDPTPTVRFMAYVGRSA
jgi:hypothetical protein